MKTDKYKKQISSIRLEKDKKTRDALKAKLNNVTFGGTFTSRGNGNLKDHSGLACMDFDGTKDAEALKQELNKSKHTLASFVSPSGNGVKVLVKIPFVDNNDDYQDYYVKILEHYNQPKYEDTGTKDIARACYMSYDPNLYINSEAEIFTDKFARPDIEQVNDLTNIPIDNENEIISRLMIWFKKRWSSSGRNTNLHTLARQFNTFGISRSECEQNLKIFEQTDFKQKEILLLIRSAYKHTADFGTKFFEDKTKTNKIKTLVYSGESLERIQESFPEIDKEKVEKEVKKQIKDVDENQFWFYTKSGQIKIAPFRYKSYLNNNNIFKFFPSDHEGFIFIKKKGNFIEEISIEKIKDFVLQDLKEKMTFEAWDMMASRPFYFSKDYMSMIETANIDLSRDDKVSCLIYYQNKAVKVTKGKFQLIDYDDLDGFVWKDQVIGRNIDLTPESNGEYKTFIWKIAGENVKRYYTFKSVIGFLLHSYKNESKDRTIIFNDQMISDVPNGGSGKGLFHKALSHIKRMSTIDGKLFDSKSSFLFQTVSPDSQVILFDDVKKGFNFTDLFSLTTGDLKIEKKGKDPIIIPFADSPKISITTNYTIKGEGGSHKRRVFEVEMSAYFNADFSPEDEFEKLLFADWDKKEWANFDNYMLRAVQFFLQKGLVASDTINLEERKIIDATNQDFLAFMDNLDFDGQRYYKTELRDLFLEDYDDYKNERWFNTRIFNKWVNLYCVYKEIKLNQGKSNGSRYLELGSESVNQDDLDL